MKSLIANTILAAAFISLPYREVNRNLIANNVTMSPEELKVAEANANPPKKKEAPKPTGRAPRAGNIDPLYADTGSPFVIQS